MSARYCGQNTILRRYLDDAKWAPQRAFRVRAQIREHRATCITCRSR